MNSTVILIILAVIVGIAYFSVRNARKQREKKNKR
jgi:preprotein translocase subunit YajC